MKYKVVLTNPDTHPPDESVFQILRGCNAQLKACTCTSHHELIEVCKDADVVLTARQAIDSETIRTLKRCRLIVRIGTGYDNIDVKAAGAAGIPVSNVPQFCTDEVADHTMALLMACARKLIVGDSMLRKGTWNPMFLMPSRRLGGQLLGLVGFGKIAQAVARRAAAFGMQVLYYDPFFGDVGHDLIVSVCDSLDDLLSRADVVSLHIPLTEQTRGMMTMTQFKIMKPTSFLLNTARGKLVVEADLIRALEQAVIAGAGLDVFESEPLAKSSVLFDLDNVVVSPHCAAHTVEALQNLRRQAYQEAGRALKKEPLVNVVNYDFLAP